MKWTKEQERVIKTRGCNLLVSAAAGSGKTAVLVARIIDRVTDPEAPLSLDRLLVMTFTRAAAEEMRERIGKALRARLKEEPDNRYLQLQRAMLPRAKISTIDSFCQQLIKQYYQNLDIDPGFRVAEEGELRLLRGKVMQTLLEEQYEAGEEAFLHFADCYSSRTDKKLSELIEQVYGFLQADPWPERFLEEQKQSCRAEEEGDFLKSPWIAMLLETIRMLGADCLMQLKEVENSCRLYGFNAYLPAVEVLTAYAKMLSEAEQFEDLYVRLASYTPPRLSPIRLKDVTLLDSLDEVKQGIDAVRKKLLAAKETYASLSFPLLTRTIRESAANSRELLELTGLFMQRYAEEKRKKNIVDFADMEHLALKLLYEEKDGAMVPSARADMLAAALDEILIDEYQDSNGLQEALLYALSAERMGRPDVFMVGDVKQSIYSFRLAKPELFLEKYTSYGAEGSNRKIELSKNFRSRAAVLRAVNQVFFPLMQRSVGGVTYDEAAALHMGAAFPENKLGGAELDILAIGSRKNETSRGFLETASLGREDYEAKWIAQRIHGLVCPHAPEKGAFVTDEGTGALRPARYRDIAILLRAPGSRVKKLVDMLGASGIPAYAEDTAGYFNALEVEVMLSCLSIIDNPHQDIPLAAVLHSPIGGFSEEKLALLRAALNARRAENGSSTGLSDLYEALKFAAGCAAEKAEAALSEAAGNKQAVREAKEAEHMPGELAVRCRRFLLWLSELRALADILPVHTLLHRLYTETGYYDIVSAMPLGETRRKNLDMLLQRAETFDATGAHSLFQFVRYIEELKEYRSDYGEASSVSEQDDLVRITSIHKSKGLEYPIVIVGYLGRSFNKTDLRDKIIIDSRLGIAADCIDLKKHVRYPNLKKNVIKAKRLRDNCGEELRVLYVAMTRAKEKLIMTGCMAEEYMASDIFRKQEYRAEEAADDGCISDGRSISGSSVLEGSSYLDWLLLSGAYENGALAVHRIYRDDLIKREVKEAETEYSSMRSLMETDAAEVIDADYEREIGRILSAEYPHEEATRLSPKLTVSALKESSYSFDDSAFEETLLQMNELNGSEEPVRLPGAGGKTAGTAYHRVMQLLDFKALCKLLRGAAAFDGALSQTAAKEFAERELVRMREAGLLSGEEAEKIRTEELVRFLRNPLAGEMARAAERGQLWREQHFMVGFPANALTPGVSTEELQLLQGVIDAYLIAENGDIILVDYKTDRVERAETLLERYETQLSLYKKALEQLLKRSLKSCLIYSTKLGQSISLQKETVSDGGKQT